MDKVMAVLLLAAATSYKPSVSLTAPVNPQLVQRRDAIAARLTPSARQKLRTIATSLAASQSITDGTTQAAITSTFGNLGSLSGADIEALAFLVLMDAAQSAQQDLQSIMDHVKQINKAKEQLRNELASLHQMPSTPSVRKVQIQTMSTSFSMPPPLPPNATVAQKQHRLDELNDLGEEQQLKMQAVSSQMQAAEQMATNVLKRVNDSSSSILRNLK
jgi:hypothetical protein